MPFRILGPRPGTEPVSPTLGVWSLNYWTTREFLEVAVLEWALESPLPRMGPADIPVLSLCSGTVAVYYPG